MTVIAGWIGKTGAAIAADTQDTWGGFIAQPVCKIFKAPGFAVAYTGPSTGQRIIGRIKWDIDGIQDLVEAIRDALEKHGWNSKADDDGRGTNCYGVGMIVLGDTGQIWEISSDLEAYERSAKCGIACGSGGAYALGAMVVLGQDPRSRVVNAVKVACTMDKNCAPPIDVCGPSLEIERVDV